MSRILDFYRQEGLDAEGRMIAEIWQWDREQLEYSHDYIQWLFPLDVESGFNPDAPVLTMEDQRAFKGNEVLQNNLRTSLELWIGFIGLTFDGGDEIKGAKVIMKGPDFEARKALWMHSNHNWLRMTRVLKSLRLCGLEKEARMFFECLQKLHEEGFVSESSFEFWERAME